MKPFITSLRISFIALILFTVLLGVIYPLVIWGVGQIFFSKKANGTLVYQNSKVIGSELIGQNFSTAKYFHPRPSSAGDNGYDAASSSGSNLGPTSQKLIDAVSDRAFAYRLENSVDGRELIPADAVTGSGSGLDPHISVKNALLQASRVASARNMSVDAVNHLIHKYSEMPTLGIFGEKRVNVLRMNLALDRTE